MAGGEPVRLPAVAEHPARGDGSRAPVGCNLERDGLCDKCGRLGRGDLQGTFGRPAGPRRARSAACPVRLAMWGRSPARAALRSRVRLGMWQGSA
jgi:hypothetical protein